MEIIKTFPGDTNFHLFENLPKALYSSDSIRHKQTENICKEFLYFCYVLSINGNVKARVALYYTPYLSYHKIKSACIGNYECTDDLEVSKILLTFIVQKIKKDGVADFLIGPMNGSTWDNYRFSAHHHHPNFLLEPYHHLYYNEHFLSFGFKSISKYISGFDKNLSCDYPDILKREHEIRKAGVVFRNINMKDYEEELKNLYSFISVAFKNNFLYTPIRWDTFRNKYIEAAKIINPEYFIMAEEAGGEVIGFIFGYHDLFNQNGKGLVIKTVARNPSKQWAGLGYVMTNLITRKAKNDGYQSIIHAFMIEQGKSTSISGKFLGDVFKNYVLYGLEIY